MINYYRYVPDTVSVTSTISNCNTIASEVNETIEPSAKEHVSVINEVQTSSNETEKKTPFSWNKAYVRLRQSLMGRKPSDTNITSASENQACVTLQDGQEE